MITEAIPTDDDRRGSIVVDYSEEVLTQWHKWYSDESDSEESDEWEPDEGSSHNPKVRKPCSPREGLDSSAMSVSSGPSNPASEDDGFEGGDHSSDEDYSCAAYKPVARNRRGRRRGGANMRSVTIPTTIASSAVAAAVKIVQRTQSEVALGSRLKPPPLKPILPEDAKPVTKIKVTAKPLMSAGLLKTVKIASIAKPVQPVSAAKIRPKPVSMVRPIQPARSIVLPQQQSSAQTVQYYQVPVQSMAGSSGVLPVQLMSSAPGQSSYQIPAGSLVLLQHPGGQTQYAMLQTLPPGANSRHVSVIMNPGSGVSQTSLPSSSTSTNYGFLSQLDGPKGTRTTRHQSTEQLHADFDSARRHARTQPQPGPPGELVGGVSPQPYPSPPQAMLHDHHATAFAANASSKRVASDTGGGPSKRARGTDASFPLLPMMSLSPPRTSNVALQQSTHSQAWNTPFTRAHSERANPMSWLSSLEGVFHPDNLPAFSSRAGIHDQVGGGCSSITPSTQLADTPAMFCPGTPVLQSVAQLHLPTDYIPPATATTPLVPIAANSGNEGTDQPVGVTDSVAASKRRGRPLSLKGKKASKKVAASAVAGLQTLAESVEPTVSCSYCGGQFLTNGVLKVHVDTTHFPIPVNVRVPFPCHLGMSLSTLVVSVH